MSALVEGQEPHKMLKTSIRSRERKYEGIVVIKHVQNLE